LRFRLFGVSNAQLDALVKAAFAAAAAVGSAAEGQHDRIQHSARQ
jgi:hypothetical protein